MDRNRCKNKQQLPSLAFTLKLQMLNASSPSNRFKPQAHILFFFNIYFDQSQRPWPSRVVTSGLRYLHLIRKIEWPKWQIAHVFTKDVFGFQMRCGVVQSFFSPLEFIPNYLLACSHTLQNYWMACIDADLPNALFEAWFLSLPPCHLQFHYLRKIDALR